MIDWNSPNALHNANIHIFPETATPSAKKKSPPETGGDVFEGAVGLAPT